MTSARRKVTDDLLKVPEPLVAEIIDGEVIAGPSAARRLPSDPTMGKLKLNMERTISAKELRASLPEIVKRTRRGERFVVLYRNRPAFRLVPITDGLAAAGSAVEDDPLFGAGAVGRSTDGLTAKDHDVVLYGARR